MDPRQKKAKARRVDQQRARSRFSSAQFPKILIRDFTKCAPKRIRYGAESDAPYAS